LIEAALSRLLKTGMLYGILGALANESILAEDLALEQFSCLLLIFLICWKEVAMVVLDGFDIYETSSFFVFF